MIALLPSLLRYVYLFFAAPHASSRPSARPPCWHACIKDDAIYGGAGIPPLFFRVFVKLCLMFFRLQVKYPSLALLACIHEGPCSSWRGEESPCRLAVLPLSPGCALSRSRSKWACLCSSKAGGLWAAAVLCASRRTVAEQRFVVDVVIADVLNHSSIARGSPVGMWNVKSKKYRFEACVCAFLFIGSKLYWPSEPELTKNG